MDKFIVSDGKEECEIEDLRYLNNIRGKLEISGLDKVKNAMEAEAAEMKNKIRIHDLTLFCDEIGMKGVAEALQPHPNLKSLTILSYGGIEWPNWMMGSCLTENFDTPLLLELFKYTSAGGNYLFLRLSKYEV